LVNPKNLGKFRTMISLKLIAFFLLLFTAINSFAEESDTTKKNQHFELSFGQSLLFISSSQQYNLLSTESIVVPTTSLLFFTEFRPQKKMRIPVFFNVATEAKQFIVAGQLVSEKVSPTFGTGVVFKIFGINIDKKSKIELEAGPLVSVIVDKRDDIRLAPVLAARFRIMRGENFVMYFGTSYSIGINAFGLIYGTGTIF